MGTVPRMREPVPFVGEAARYQTGEPRVDSGVIQGADENQLRKALKDGGGAVPVSFSENRWAGTDSRNPVDPMGLGRLDYRPHAYQSTQQRA